MRFDALAHAVAATPPGGPPTCWRARRAASRLALTRAGRGGSGWAMLAWRHTFTKRWPAVNEREGQHHPEDRDHQAVEEQREAEGDDPLGPLHQAAAGVEAERLGLGPLVGDQQRGGEHGERQHGDAARLGGGEVPGDAAEEQGVGEAVGHRVEEGATAPMRCPRPWPPRRRARRGRR